MANGKVRSQSHLIDQKAILHIRQKLPEGWVVRELSPDYGIDLDVELFVKEHGQVVTLGEHLYMQVKGTTCAKYKNISIEEDEIKVVKKCLVFQLDTALLRLVERVGDSLPILLVTIDMNTNEAFFVCLNDYVNFFLCTDTDWRTQKTKVIYVPCNNCIESTRLLRWYALRPKLNAFFAQSSALIDDLEYAGSSEIYIQKVRDFALRNSESDIWNCIDLGFTFMEPVYDLINPIINEVPCLLAERALSRYSDNDLVSIGTFDDISLKTGKDLFTCRQFIQNLRSSNSIFSSCIRQLFVNTEYEALVSI